MLTEEQKIIISKGIRERRDAGESEEKVSAYIDETINYFIDINNQIRANSPNQKITTNECPFCKKKW